VVDFSTGDGFLLCPFVETRDVRYWHKADIRVGPAFVRSWTIADIAGFWLGDGLSAFDPTRTFA
jgi:hypothetical protein